MSWKIITAIVCVTALQITNLLTANIDGAVMTTVFGIVAGLAGYEYAKNHK